MRIIHWVLKKIYKAMFFAPIQPIAEKIDRFLEKHGGVLYRATIGREKNLIHYGSIGKWKFEETFEKTLWSYEDELETEYNPLVSIIVPNYNHEPYLGERLDSIYNQTYKNFEVLLLDDCSSDNSRDILEEYSRIHKENTITVFNKNNVGKVFKQWNNGLYAAKGELVWIAESDDYCESNFLEEMVELFRYESLMIAFARSEFVQNGKKMWSTEGYMADIPFFKWNKPFIMTAAQIVRNGFAYKNMIPNVSSAVFRNIKKFPEEIENICENLSLCGDWVFYLSIMKGGTVAYTNKTTNYYRIHQESTSLKVQKTFRYYEEWEIVGKYIARNYKVKERTFEDVLLSLKKHYQAVQKTDKDEVVEQYYHVESINLEKEKRKPNILMGCYALISGGGETYPLYLANEMRRQGLSVTLLNFNMEKRDDDIRKILHHEVPLVTIKTMDYFNRIIKLLDGDVIHSHHGSVDVAVSRWIANNDIECKQLISLHGMYEALEEKNRQDVLATVTKTCGCFAYTADKNLQSFMQIGYYSQNKDKFVKVDNGLPELEIVDNPVTRELLEIEENAFILCLVSRGIPEKGWEEGIRTVEAARKRCNRPIHLIIIGDGKIRNKLEKEASSNIHFMGVRQNIRDYFSISDIGFLPSRFPGESYPLVVADCLICGKPVLATDIAEIRNQLMDENGELAGKLIPVQNWIINEKEMEERIVELVENQDEYNILKSRTASASKKFNITHVVHKYLELYQRC